MSEYLFNAEEELKDVGSYAGMPGPYGMYIPPVRKFNTPITAKENFERIKNHEMPLWCMTMTGDFNMIQPEIMPDAYARNHGGIDWFGIDWQFEPQTAAGMVRPGTRALSDLCNWETEIKWPDLNAIDWEADYKKNYEPILDKDRPTMFIIVNGFFERLADLTSFSDAFCYLLEEEETLHAFYDRLTQFHIDLIAIAKKYYHADMITFHDDMGTQRSSFMSPDTYEEILLPHYQKVVKAAHEMGVLINYHSCGSVTNQIPNFIKAGFDFWEGQDACNNKAALMEEYGDQLGQCSVYMPSPELSDEEFVADIKKTIDTVGSKGRFIAWFGDMKPGRSVDGAEVLYSYSRIKYCGEQK